MTAQTTTRYRRIDAGAVVHTAGKLVVRIDDRLPGRGVGRVAREVRDAAREAEAAAAEAQRPIAWLRVLSIVAGTGLAAVAVWVAVQVVRAPAGEVRRLDLVGSLEAGVNEVILLGAALAFLLTAERRVKRRRVLLRLAELRALAHVVDMHQLTKDPDRLRRDYALSGTSPSPALDLPLMTRYLDYCSEMLALVGKIAALYAQDLDDAVVLDTVSEIEQLTSATSRTIWQKLTILGALDAMDGRPG